jgi:hypothetical protein
MTRTERGEIAFCKTGDAQPGEWAGAVILPRYGDVPDNIVPYTSDW